MLEIYTDGSCQPNPGNGGWGFMIVYDDSTIAYGGYEENTTNNRMEIISVIKAIEVLVESFSSVDKVKIYSDSQYVINTLTKGWQRNKNTDLWSMLDDLISKYKGKILWQWIKGHNYNRFNETVDQIANLAREKRKEIVI